MVEGEIARKYIRERGNWDLGKVKEGEKGEHMRRDQGMLELGI